MTPIQPPKDNFYIPPTPDGSPPPEKKSDNTFWIILGIIIIAAVFLLPVIIAAFVFGMAGNIEHTKVVAATAQKPDAGTILVTYQGGQDAGMLVAMTVTISDSKGQEQTKTLGSRTGTSPLVVGDKRSFSGAFSGKDHVIATGHFSDGTDQVILDAYI